MALEPGAWARVEPLVRASPTRSHGTFAHAVLEGRQPGKVFVDDGDEPRGALVGNDSGFWLAFGEPDEAAFRPFVPELLAHHLPDEATMLLATSPAWDALLVRLFARRVERLGFEFHPSAEQPLSDWRGRVPPGLAVEPLDERRARQIAESRAGRQGLDPWFVRISGGPAAFASQGLGFCVVADDQPISIAAPCAIGGGEVEFEVGTVPAWEGRGLASLICAAFVEQCLAYGLRPAYTCAADNPASAAIARKLGFAQTERVSGYPLNRTFVEQDGRWE